MSKCQVTQFPISNETYTTIRKKKLENLIQNYQKYSTKLIELNNDSNINKREISELNSNILNLQQKIFLNNEKSLNLIEEQKNNISKKHNANNINNNIIITQHDILDKNQSLISLTENQVKENNQRKSNIDRTYTIFIGVILLVIIGTITMLILHKDLNDNII